MDTTLISIITINYNDKKGLEKTIKSVVNQSYTDFEYIVIDGGSEDGSKDVIAQFQDKIDYSISEKDNGVYNAMNKGIRNAKGQYLLFLNSGDEFYSSTVLEENNGSIHSEDLVYFDIIQVFKDRKQEHKFPSKLNFNTFHKGTIGHPTTFIKKELFDKIGLYDEDLRIVSDWKFFTLAIVKFNCSYKKVDAFLSNFYMDGMSTINQDSTNNERKKVLDECFSENLRLNELEHFVHDLKKSRLIKLLNRLGFLNSIEKI